MSKLRAARREPQTASHLTQLAACCSWLVAAFALLAPRVLPAQDIHFSQFFQTALATSPGNIGAFDGDYRVSGVYRQQWKAVTRPFSTFGFGGDARNFLHVEGLGAGAWLYNDKAGDSRLNQFHLDVGASWTERFGGSQEHSLTGGLQVGFTSLTLDEQDLSFDSQYNGFYYDPSLNTNEQFARDGFIHPDVHAGFTYIYAPAKRESIQLGLGMFNLTTPKIGFLGGPGVPLDRRTALSVITQFPVAEKLDILPMIQYMAQGKFHEFDIGGAVRYIMLDRWGMVRAVRIGAFYRASDAGYLYAGLEHDDWTLGISYDINVSDLVPASAHRGGIEFTAVRIFRQKPAVPARYKACPDQM